MRALEWQRRGRGLSIRALWLPFSPLCLSLSFPEQPLGIPAHFPPHLILRSRREG